jgi:isocitrate dehydrogenase kinase/phosphatase
MKHHADLLDPARWQAHKQRIADGVVEDVFPYPQQIRFCHQTEKTQPTPPAPMPAYLENQHNE